MKTVLRHRSKEGAAVAAEGASTGGGKRPLRSTEQGHRPGRRIRLTLQSAAVVLGIAVAVLVMLGGGVLWAAVRVFAVVVVAAAAVVCVRRAGRGSTGLVTLLAGFVGTAVGAGIGVPHALDTGFSLPTVAGVAALLSGLVLLVSGIVLLAGMLPGWWRLLAIPGTLVLLQLLLPLTGAVAATNVPPDAPVTRTPADVGLTYQDVGLTTADGVHLVAWYVPSRNGAAVLLLPGSGSTRTSTLDHAAVLAKHGYGVLLLDTRGHGKSGGHAMDFGWYGDVDIEAAIDYLGTRPDVRGGRIAEVGLSMGGEQALGAAALDARILAVVAEGATNRVLADKAWLPRDPDGLLQRGLDGLMYGVADILSGSHPPIGLRSAVIAMVPRRVLLIAAGDVPEEALAGRYYRAASPSNVALWEVPGSSHTGALSTHPAEWDERVTGFLDVALGVQPAV